MSEQKKKILVIDDSPFIFKTIKKALEPEGYCIVGHARNGRQGIEMEDKLKPDLITLDITMPVMDGIQTAEILFKKNKETKIIMMSAMGDQEIIGQAENVGIKHFLTKPFKKEEIIEKINELVSCKP